MQSLLSPTPVMSESQESVPTYGDERTVYSGLLPNGAKVKYLMWKVLSARNISFAGAIIPVAENTLKQGMEISDWPWVDTSDSLEVNILFTSSDQVVRSQFIGVSDRSIVQLSLGTDKYLLRADFIAVASMQEDNRDYVDRLQFAYNTETQTVR